MADSLPRDRVDTVVVGLGPAGTALVRAAAVGGVLDDWLESGALFVDAEGVGDLGAGSLSHYEIRSDTAGTVFTECTTPVLAGRVGGAAARAIEACHQPGPVPLKTAARLLTLAAEVTLARLHTQEPPAVVQARVDEIRRVDGGFQVRLTSREGGRSVLAKKVVLANGGSPWIDPQVVTTRMPLVHSDEVMRRLPVHHRRQLRLGSPRVVVVGGSHSAFGAAKLLLALDHEKRWPKASLTIVHRSPIKVTYDDPTAARRDGCCFDDDDVCPRTGKVFRFGGLRGDAADLYRRIRDGREPRVALVRCGIGGRAVAGRLGPADLVVAATGYRSAAAPLLKVAPQRVTSGRDATVLIDGAPVPGLYAIGLGAGRRRDSRSGGEPSYQGTIDGVWFYENVVGPALLERLFVRPSVSG